MDSARAWKRGQSRLTAGDVRERVGGRPGVEGGRGRDRPRDESDERRREEGGEGGGRRERRWGREGTRMAKRVRTEGAERGKGGRREEGVAWPGDAVGRPWAGGDQGIGVCRCVLYAEKKCDTLRREGRRPKMRRTRRARMTRTTPVGSSVTTSESSDMPTCAHAPSLSPHSRRAQGAHSRIRRDRSRDGARCLNSYVQDSFLVPLVGVACGCACASPRRHRARTRGRGGRGRASGRRRRQPAPG